jgi:hypothetical protein
LLNESLFSLSLNAAVRVKSLSQTVVVVAIS